MKWEFGKKLNKPIDDFNHLMDAMRYALESFVMGETFSFDFMEAGVNVADNFDDIVEFMSLWAYLRQESLILEVPRDIVADDLGILFELKHRGLHHRGRDQ